MMQRVSNTWFLKAIFILVCASTFDFEACLCQNNSILFGKSISEEQSIVSSGGVFALGFFNPTGNSTNNRYVGIWYNSIPEAERTVVWVAIRENPINTSSKGMLKIVDDGNLVIMNGDGVILWSSNVSGVRANTTATLSDKGNFILRTTTVEGGEIWQSFDHPTDTVLPEMKLRFDFKSRVSQRLVAWKSPTNPMRGDISCGFDPNSPLQIVLWKGTRTLFRYGIWNGQQTNTIPEYNASSVLVETIVVNDKELYYSYAATERFSVVRRFIDPVGSLNTSMWDSKLGKWRPFHEPVPTPPCEVYDICSKFGTCEDFNDTRTCSCLEGFTPQNRNQWNMGNPTDGCTRKVPLKCDGSDQFEKMIGVYFPDHFSFESNLSEVQCMDKCSNNCNCTAYAHTNSTTDLRDFRCFTWYNELRDIRYQPNVGGQIHVRIASSTISDTSMKKSGNSGILVKALSSAISTVILLVIIYFSWRRLKAKGWLYAIIRRPIVNETVLKEVSSLSYDSIVKATDSFSEANKLGEGGFGPVYKGKLLDGQEIAVKRLSKSSGQGLQEFKTEVELIANLQHANLIRLLGWCVNNEEKIIVYEYLPNLSLDKYIFDSTLSQVLTWSKRYCIIEGIAQGLLYLHKYSRPRVIHRDLKSSNILLDEDLNPKISDFGLARIVGGNQTEGNTNTIVGTYGYMSPEYALDGCFSEKSDVFSFGVVVLEIITGKRSTGLYPYKESVNLLGYISQLWEEGRALEIIDKSMEGKEETTTTILKCIQVGLLCVQDDVADRPTMSSVIEMLCNENMTLPRPTRPTFTYRRHLDRISQSSSSSHQVVVSANQLTNTLEEGR